MKAGTIVVEMKNGKTFVASSGHEGDALAIAQLIGENSGVASVKVGGRLIAGEFDDIVDIED